MTSDPRIVQREVINEFIDLVWERSLNSKYGRPRIYVAGRPFLTCSFLVVKVDPSDPANQGATVEQLADRPGASVLEGQDAVGTTIDGYTLSKEDVMFGFRSSIEGWIRNDYNTQCLAANLSFPLLKEVAQAGDKKAQRVLQAEIIKRLKEDYPATTIVVLETCMNVIDEDTTAWIVKHLIEPHLGEVESEKLNWFVKITELSVPLATALLGSKDARVRRQAYMHIHRFKELLSDQEKRLIMNVLKHETRPVVIQEFAPDIDDPAISAAILGTLLKNIQHYQAGASMHDQAKTSMHDSDEVFDHYVVIKSIVENSITSPETLSLVMDFARFKSMVDVEDSLDSQFHVIPMFDKRSAIVEAVIKTHHAPHTAIEQAIGTLKLIEDTREAAGELLKLRLNEKKAKMLLAAEARSLRRAITSEPAAGPFLMPLTTTFVQHYHNLRAARSEKGWDVLGMTGPGTAGYRSVNYTEANWEFEEFLRYTGLKAAAGWRTSDIIDLDGTYTLTLFTGTWKSLQDFAEKQGMKMGRAPFVVPLLAYRVYESVYFKDGNVFRLDEYSTPAARLWSRTGSDESGHQWKPVQVSKKLADYMR